MNEEKINREKPGSVRLHYLKGNTAVCLLYKVKRVVGLLHTVNKMGLCHTD